MIQVILQSASIEDVVEGKVGRGVEKEDKEEKEDTLAIDYDMLST